MRLSGGEQARVTFARVLAQNARVILLDEPTAALDISHQQRIMSIAHTLALRGHTVIAIMHDIQLAAQYCHRITLMKNGETVTCGNPMQVLTSERLSDVYEWPIRVEKFYDGNIAILPQSH